MSRPFVFRHRWSPRSDPERVVDLLLDPEGYPRWWPQVRAADRLDDDRVRVVVRSVVPVPMTMTMIREVEDRGRGVFRVGLVGDLLGHVDLRVTGTDRGCDVLWEQVAQIEHPRLSRAAAFPPARALMRANHTVMMRSVARALDDLGGASDLGRHGPPGRSWRTSGPAPTRRFRLADRHRVSSFRRRTTATLT